MPQARSLRYGPQRFQCCCALARPHAISVGFSSIRSASSSFWSATAPKAGSIERDRRCCSRSCACGIWAALGQSSWSSALIDSFLKKFSPTIRQCLSSDRASHKSTFSLSLLYSRVTSTTLTPEAFFRSARIHHQQPTSPSFRTEK